jgi:hypothetical protein
MEKVFSNIYEKSIWGSNNNPNYKGSSGSGSDINYNINTYIPFLKKFITKNNIKSVVDLGCGDFRCGPLIYHSLDVKYTGYDTYDKIIKNNLINNPNLKYNFIHSDFFKNKENIISSDLCILKDVIQHWSLHNIYTFLDYLVESKKFKYILVCNCCNQTQDNTDIKDGDFRQLSANFFPLKKYNFNIQYKYNSKEISGIKFI